MAAWTLTGPEQQSTPKWTLTGPEEEQAKPTPPGMTMDFNRKPPVGSEGFPLGNPFTDPNTQYDPVAAIAQLGAGAAKYLGMSDTNAAKIGRDIHALPSSLGPLGYEFAPLDSIPRPKAPAPIPSSQGMPRASVRAEKDLFESGGARMNEAKLSEATIDPTDLQSATVNLHNRLREKALAIDPKAHPKAARLMRRLQIAVGDERPYEAGMTGYQAKPRTMQELHLLRQEADDVIGGSVRPDGRMSTEGLLGKEMKNSIDEMIAKHPDGPKLMQGISEWAKGEKSRIISDAMNKAKNSRAWANGNEAAAIQSALRPLLDNKKYRNTWTPEQREFLTKLTRRKLGNMVSTFGSTSMAGIAFGRLVEGFLGIPATSLLFLGVPARAARNKSIAAGAERFGEMVRAGEALEPAGMEKLTKTLSPDVVKHVLSNRRGAELVRRWTVSPAAQTARALAAFVANEVKQPELANRIFNELQED